MEPQELADLVKGIRTVKCALGDGRKHPALSEVDTAAVARKSLVAAKDIPAGSVLSHDMLAIKRPGTGLPPGMLDSLVGRRTHVSISRDTLIRLDMLS